MVHLIEHDANIPYAKSVTMSLIAPSTIDLLSRLQLQYFAYLQVMCLVAGILLQKLSPKRVVVVSNPGPHHFFDVCPCRQHFGSTPFYVHASPCREIKASCLPLDLGWASTDRLTPPCSGLDTPLFHMPMLGLHVSVSKT